jgi:hypothetical protein
MLLTAASGCGEGSAEPSTTEVTIEEVGSGEETAVPLETSSPTTTSGQSGGCPSRPSWFQCFSARGQWSWQQSTADGYRFLTHAAVGEFRHLSDAPALPGAVTARELVSVCPSFDETTDAVAPAALMMTNKTTGFPALLEASLFAYQNLGRPTPWRYVLLVAPIYSDGMQCHEISQSPASSGEWSVSWGEIAPGASTGAHYAYVVIPDYFTPNHPSGDPEKLRRAILGLDTVNKHLDWFKGPGVVRPSPDLYQGFLKLSGKQT